MANNIIKSLAVKIAEHAAVAVAMGGLGLAASALVTFSKEPVSLALDTRLLAAILVLTALLAYAIAVMVGQHRVRQLRQEAAEHEQALRARITELERDVSTDPLTGAYTKRYGEQLLASRMSEAGASGKALSVLFIDVDGFKQVNDGHGHSAGDLVLTHLVAQITPRSRDDVICRFGGDEFLILCAFGTDLVGAYTLAERLRQNVDSYRFPIELGSTAKTQLTISCGVAAYHAGDTAEGFMKRASDALQIAKRDKNCVVMQSSV